MLINTVVLFLRDALPIFVLVCFLWVHLPFHRNWLPLSIVAGVLLNLLYINQIDLIGEWFDGAGIEVSLWVFQLLGYLVVLTLGYKLIRPKHKHLITLPILAGTIVTLTLVTKGANFVLYFSGYLHQTNALQSMLIGTFLGLGICLSLGILLYFGALWLKEKCGSWVTWLLLLVYSTGQLTNTLPLLVQVDLIHASDLAWDSTNLISNQSELGHLFNVLFGYQATPSVTQAYTFIVALVLPLMTFFWTHKRAKINPGIEK